MKISSFKEALEYLDSFIKPVVFAKIRPEDAKLKDPLDRMRRLLELLGNPQKKFQSVLIGGTSGKGSTSYLIAHMLTTVGYKTGYTLSPHLQKVTERIQVGKNQKSKIKNQKNKSKFRLCSSSEAQAELRSFNSSRQARTISTLRHISDEEFVTVLNNVIPAVEQMQKENFEPSHFEILIAMAFVYFVKEKVDIAVVEVGLGGKYDATNTLEPLVAVLTNVSLDHTAILGNTVEEIAREKVGIIKGKREPFDKAQGKRGKGKERKIVVTGVRQPSVIKIVEKRCGEVGAQVYRLNKDFIYEIKQETENGTLFDFTSFCHSEAKPSTGRYLAKLKNLSSNNEYKRSFANAQDDRDSLENFFLSLPGSFQVENASLAIQTILQLRKFGFEISEENIREALKTAFVPGRFEILKIARGPGGLYPHPISSVSASWRIPAGTRWGSPAPATPRNYTLDAKRYTLILDGAHNPEKMRSFVRSLKTIFRVKELDRKIGSGEPFDKAQGKSQNDSSRLRSNDKKFVFIISFKEGKDISEMLEEIVPIADAIIVTQFHTETYYGGGGAVGIEEIKNKIKKIEKKLKQDLQHSSLSDPAWRESRRVYSDTYSLRQDGYQTVTRQAQARTRVSPVNVYEAVDSKRALELAFEIVHKNTIIVVTGSLYFVGEMRDVLQLRA